MLLDAEDNDHEFVFARAEGSPTHPELLSATFERIVARSGLPRIRLHDIRHTHATLVLTPASRSRSSADGSATPRRASRSTCTADLPRHARPKRGRVLAADGRAGRQDSILFGIPNSGSRYHAPQLVGSPRSLRGVSPGDRLSLVPSGEYRLALRNVHFGV